MKMMMAAAALLMEAGGALAQQTPLARAHDRLSACFIARADALDDRTSDAGSVARGVLSSCSAERQAVEDAARAAVPGSKGLTVEDRARVRDGLIDRATAVVLAQRRARTP